MFTALVFLLSFFSVSRSSSTFPSSPLPPPPSYLNAIHTSCPHILRYITAAVITNKRRQSILKDLIRVIKRVSPQNFAPFSNGLFEMHTSLFLSYPQFLCFQFSLSFIHFSHVHVLLSLSPSPLSFSLPPLFLSPSPLLSGVTCVQRSNHGVC